VVAGVATLLRAAGLLGVPALATLQNEARMGGPIPEIGGLLPEGCPTLDKLTFSCLGRAAIREALAGSGRGQVLLCGVETHVCVSQTAHDLLAAGYQVHVAADAVSARTEANHKVGLRRLERAGAQPSSVETALYELLREAGTERFRGVLKLVR
jgi:hypothetical protein